MALFSHAKRSEMIGAIPLLYCFFLGNIGFLLFPFWLGALIREWGISNAEAGAIVTLQLLSAAAASLLFAAITKLISRRNLLICGMALQVAANLWCCYLVYNSASESLMLIGSGRLFAGLGDGLVLATVNANIARSPNPQKLFSWGFLAVALFSALTFAVVPGLTTYVETKGIPGVLPLFMAIAFYALIGLLFFRREFSPADAGPDQPLQTNDRQKNLWRLLPLAAVFMLFAGIGSIYAYIEPIAVAGGLTPADVGHIKAIGSLIIIAGPVIAGVLGTKNGYITPILMGLVVLVCANIAMSNADAITEGTGFYWLYAVSLISHDLAGLFLMIYTMSFIASLDSSGKLAATVPAFQTFGGAIGPGIGGLIGDAFGYYALGPGAAIFYLLYYALLVASSLIGRKQECSESQTTSGAEIKQITR